MLGFLWRNDVIVRDKRRHARDAYLKAYRDRNCQHDWKPQRTRGEWPQYCTECGGLRWSECGA